MVFGCGSNPGRLGSDPGAVAVSCQARGALGPRAVVAAVTSRSLRRFRPARPSRPNRPARPHRPVLSLSPSLVSAATVGVVDDGVGALRVVAWAMLAPPNSRVKAVRDTPSVLRIEFRSKEIESVHGDRERVCGPAALVVKCQPPMTHWAASTRRPGITPHRWVQTSN